jgi:GT2 family glycosyltransferase
MEPKVELIIVNYGTQELIKQSIYNLLHLTDYPNFHITIIDNCSIDGSWEEIKNLCYKYPDQISAWQTHINKGYGKALNDGAKLSDAEYLVLMNSDIFVARGEEDWIRPLIKVFEDNKDVAIVVPKLWNQQRQLIGGPVHSLNPENGVNRYWLQQDEGQFDLTEECLTVCGAVMMVDKGIFMSLGGFHEEYHHYFEETDLCFMARSKDYKVFYTGDSVLIHLHMASEQNQDLLGSYMGEGKQIFDRRWKDFLEDETK